MVRGVSIYEGHEYRLLKKSTLYALRTAFFLFLWVLLQNNSYAQVTADFSASVTRGCSPLVVCFTDLSTGNPDTWLWDFGNGNFSPDHNPCAIYINPGTYTVSLTASNTGGSDTKTVNAMITVFANPVVDFSADNALGCAPETISFTDETTLGDAPLVSWRWDFGDGNTSTQQNPSNTYTNPGTYTVVLEVADTNGCVHSKSVSNMITILASPNVDFTPMPSSSCGFPVTVTFQDQSTGSMITDYFWDLDDGATSTLQNPVHTYNSPGTYDVSLTLTNSAGCTATKTLTDFLGNGGLNADFSVDDTDGCGSVSPDFEDQSTSSGTIVDWLWDFGDGGTSNVQNTTHNYTVPGTYDVTLIVTDNSGCTDTTVYDDLITVYVRPSANFTADNTTGCSLPFTVNFTETATDDVSWLWEFGDGNTSTQQNPSHSYAAPGSYGVRLTVTSADGCTRTSFKPDYIKITSPSANFWADVNQGCLDLTVNFNDQSTSSSAITNWNWNFGDSGTSTQENPSHTYTTEGTFDVRLVITNADGCTDTIVKTGYIAAGEEPNVQFGSDKQFACLGTPIQFYDSSDIGDEWIWDFGDGTIDTSQNPVHTYTDTGAFNVTLIVFSNGCSDTLTRSGFVTIAPPRADFEAVHSCTNPFEVTFVDSSLGPDDWHWNFGDGDTSDSQNTVHTFASTGNYTVSLFVENISSGCVDSIAKVVRVTDPAAAFTDTFVTGCYPLVVNFSSNSVDADAYQWFFGDGDTSSQENPIKVYDTSGVFDVKLIVTDIHGCMDSIEKTDLVTVLGAHAWFEGDTLFGCTPLTVDYADSSSSFLGTITSWTWEFGDGNTSNLQNPTNVYTEPGLYSVTLRVTDSNGCMDSLRRVNYIIPTYPAADFIADDTIVCVGEDVRFNNLSIGSGMSYLWDFGDGTTSTDFLPVHAYSAEGIYTVSLIATDVNGCDSTKIRPLYIEVVQPQAALTADSTFASCPPLWVNFTDLTPAADSIVSWLWNFGDNQTSDLQHPTHVYTVSDTFLPSLIVTDFNGCRDTAYFVPITLTGPKGTFDFIQDDFCIPVAVPFFSDAADTIIHVYDYGDGNIGIFIGGDTIVHDYTYPGVFHPSLVLDDGHGCVISIDHPDSIITFGLIADFSSDISYICRQNLVHFYDSSFGVSNPLTWFWDFGDGDTSALQNPTHYYSVPGKYDVMLVVTNIEGCTDTVIKPSYITVDPGPIADFTMNDADVCIPETINFSDASVSDSTIVSWEWDFGDGGIDSVQNPSHTYTTVDTFTINLIIETNVGCRDTVNKPVITNGPPIADAGPDQAVCIGDTASLTGSGGLTYSWSPGTAISDPNISNPSAFPTNTTTYTLTVYDSLGCSDTDNVIVTVHPLPVVGSTTAAICIGDTAQLSASGGVSYSWSPAATLNNPNISNPVANPDSTTTYTVVVTDSNGCVNAISTTLTVHPLPIPMVSSANKFLCNGQSVQLNATGGVNYSWSPATWLNNVNIPNPVSTPPLSAAYTVTVTDHNGCRNQASISVTVYPLPLYSIGPDTTICQGETAHLNVNGGSTFNWTPATGLSCDTCSNPSASPDSTTKYYVDITNSVGCTVTDSITVTVIPTQTITISKDTFVCSGSGVQLGVSGGVNYQWSPAAGLDNPFVPFPVASPDSSTTYTVNVISPSGCSKNDSVRVEVLDFNADMTLSQNMGCLPVNVQFTDLSSSDDTIVSWQWDFDNGRFSSAQNPQHVFGVAGSYDVKLTITTARGCIDSVEAPVIVHDLPEVIAGPDTAICYGESVQLYSSGGVYYNWSPSVGLNAIDIPNPVATPNATRYYELIVTDANGCTNSDSVLVMVNALPVPTISAGTSLCYGDSTQLGATGGYSYSWSPAAGLNNPNIANPVASPEVTTVYVVDVATEFGCNAVDSVMIVIHPKPVLVVKAENEICIGDSTQFNLTGAVSYEWSPAAGLSCLTCPDPVANPDTTTAYIVKMTDSYNCPWYDTIPLVINPVPQVQTTDDKTICKGESVLLLSQHVGATSFEWTPRYGLNYFDTLSPIASPEQTTEYIIIARNQYGCTDRDSVVVNVIEQIQTLITENMRICRGATVTLEAQIEQSGISEGSVLWLPLESFDDPTQPLQTVSPAETVTYMVIASGGQCASDTQYVHVHVDESPDVDAGEDQTVMAGTEVSFTATSNYEIVTYYWSPSAEVSCIDCQTTSVIAEESGTYYVSVTDANGCPAMDSVRVRVIKTCDGDIWVPNAFTPNGDEVNDDFRVRSVGFIDLISFRVFDRWGNLVFKTDNINEGWNGKYKGDFVNPDVYVWWVRAACPDGEVVEKKGNVTAIR